MSATTIVTNNATQSTALVPVHVPAPAPAPAKAASNAPVITPKVLASVGEKARRGGSAIREAAEHVAVYYAPANEADRKSIRDWFVAGYAASVLGLTVAEGRRVQSLGNSKSNKPNKRNEAQEAAIRAGISMWSRALAMVGLEPAKKAPAKRGTKRPSATGAGQGKPAKVAKGKSRLALARATPLPASAAMPKPFAQLLIEQASILSLTYGKGVRLNKANHKARAASAIADCLRILKEEYADCLK